MNEEYLKTGKAPPGHCRADRVVQGGSALPWMPCVRASCPRIRHCSSRPHACGFAVAGVPVSPMSKCDVVTEAGIIDWKTTSDIEKYGKTPGELATDVQMLIYGRRSTPKPSPSPWLTGGTRRRVGLVSTSLP